jgi:hypothetical protein
VCWLHEAKPGSEIRRGPAIGRPGGRVIRLAMAWKKWRLLPLFLGGAVLLGSYIPYHRNVSMAGALLVAMVAATLVIPGYPVRVFLGLLGALLIGYAFFGKTFAYLSFGPIFIGEVVLAAGLMAAVSYRRWHLPFQSPVIRVLFAFMVWQAARAIPSLSTYGLDTLRDSALWGYGTFAFLVVLLLPASPSFERIPDYYRRWILLFLVWAPIALLSSHLLRDLLPLSPTSGEPMNLMKAGDAGAHLGGMAAFLLLGLDRFHRDGDSARKPRLRPVWGAWLVTFICVAALGRGGALAALGAIFVVFTLRPQEAFARVPLIIGVSATALLLLLAINLNLELGRRDLSVRQVGANLGTIIGLDPPQEMGNLEKTRDWRLRWWSSIVDYTIHGRHFWGGKGYGVSLAVDDRVTLNKFNRSPHSAHLNFLARSGVPGLMLWGLVQGVFGLVMIHAYFRARRLQKEWWARVNLWILAYWVAFLINASIDVFLESPTGGIWFWSLMGFGAAIAEAQRRSLMVTSLRRPPRHLYEAAAAT